MSSLNSFKKSENSKKRKVFLMSILGGIGNFIATIFESIFSPISFLILTILIVVGSVVSLIALDSQEIEIVEIVKTKTYKVTSDGKEYDRFEFLVKYPDKTLHEVSVTRQDYNDKEYVKGKIYYYSHMTDLYMWLIIGLIASIILFIVLIIVFAD